jgi:hypothetical protein
VCSSVGRPARTSSIATGTKEEQQIRVETEFGLERGKTRVEGERIRVGEVLICFDCPQSVVASCIYWMGWSYPNRTRQFYL